MLPYQAKYLPFLMPLQRGAGLLRWNKYQLGPLGPIANDLFGLDATRFSQLSTWLSKASQGNLQFGDAGITENLLDQRYAALRWKVCYRH